MEVYALVGASGTGKSTKALPLTYEKEIPAVIDDGLFIFKGERVAGYSAKFEKTKLAAIKRATFYNADHATEVRKVLETYQLRKILILGTSHKMVDLIARKLSLDKIKNYIDITEVSTPSEVKLALFMRKTRGNHVMPVASEQIKESFLKRLIKKSIKIFSSKKEIIGETTVVQPDFHTDTVSISSKVYHQIIQTSCQSMKEVHTVEKTEFQMSPLPKVKAELKLYYTPTETLLNEIKKIQQKIYSDFNVYLNLELERVDLHISRLV